MAEMKQVNVLQDFDASDDGIRVRKLLAGTKETILSSLFPGLHAAGFVEELAVDASTSLKPSEPPTPDDLVLPDDWRDMHHLKLLGLAKRIDPSVTNKAEAIAALEAYEAKRA
jgi:hypothetical protein